MALLNESNNYFLIKDVTISKNLLTDVYTCVIRPAGFKDEATRNSLTEFDREKNDAKSFNLNQTQVDALIAVLYPILKTVAPYDTMSDV